MCLIFLALIGLLGTKSSVNASTGLSFSPTYELIDGTEVVWQKPDGAPKGVVFLAHGCGHGAIDFWPVSSACPTCIGLPEELNMTGFALSRGYVVLAVSSVDRTHRRCWHTKGAGKHDLASVKLVLDTLLPREGLTTLPVFALGASSGGHFVLMMAMEYPFAGICSQIMAVPPEALQEALQGMLRKYPPTVFVHMPRDEYTASLVQLNMQALKSQGVPVSEIEFQPGPMSPTYLSDRSPQSAPGVPGPEIPPDMSRAIHTALLAAGLVDKEGFLTQDPRRSNWREVLQGAHIAGFESLRHGPDESAISEELNVLFAGHEIVSDTMDATFAFWEKHAAAGVTASATAGATAATAQAH